jgi:hypothetical protein
MKCGSVAGADSIEVTEAVLSIDVTLEVKEKAVAI